MPDTIAWCLLAYFRVSNVVIRIVFECVEAVCDFMIGILNGYLSGAIIQPSNRKKKSNIPAIPSSGQHKIARKKTDYKKNVPKTRKPQKKDGDSSGDEEPRSKRSSGTISFHTSGEAFQCNLRTAKKVSVIFEFMPVDGKSSEDLYRSPSGDDTFPPSSESASQNKESAGNSLLDKQSSKRSFDKTQENKHTERKQEDLTMQSGSTMANQEDGMQPKVIETRGQGSANLWNPNQNLEESLPDVSECEHGENIRLNVADNKQGQIMEPSVPGEMQCSIVQPTERSVVQPTESPDKQKDTEQSSASDETQDESGQPRDPERQPRKTGQSKVSFGKKGETGKSTDSDETTEIDQALDPCKKQGGFMAKHTSEKKQGEIMQISLPTEEQKDTISPRLPGDKQCGSIHSSVAKDKHSSKVQPSVTDKEVVVKPEDPGEEKAKAAQSKVSKGQSSISREKQKATAQPRVSDGKKSDREKQKIPVGTEKAGVLDGKEDKSEKPRVPVGKKDVARKPQVSGGEEAKAVQPKVPNNKKEAQQTKDSDNEMIKASEPKGFSGKETENVQSKLLEEAQVDVRTVHDAKDNIQSQFPDEKQDATVQREIFGVKQDNTAQKKIPEKQGEIMQPSLPDRKHSDTVLPTQPDYKQYGKIQSSVAKDKKFSKVQPSVTDKQKVVKPEDSGEEKAKTVQPKVSIYTETDILQSEHLDKKQVDIRGIHHEKQDESMEPQIKFLYNTKSGTVSKNVPEKKQGDIKRPNFPNTKQGGIVSPRQLDNKHHGQVQPTVPKSKLSSEVQPSVTDKKQSSVLESDVFVDKQGDTVQPEVQDRKRGDGEMPRLLDGQKSSSKKVEVLDGEEGKSEKPKIPAGSDKETEIAESKLLDEKQDVRAISDDNEVLSEKQDDALEPMSYKICTEITGSERERRKDQISVDSESLAKSQCPVETVGKQDLPADTIITHNKDRLCEAAAPERDASPCSTVMAEQDPQTTEKPHSKEEVTNIELDIDATDTSSIHEIVDIQSGSTDTNMSNDEETYSDVMFEKGPSLDVPSDFLLKPVDSDPAHSNFDFSEEYSMLKLNKVDSMVYSYIMNSEISVEDSTPFSDRFKCKTGKIADDHNAMTGIPKYHDRLREEGDKFVLEKSEIKCYYQNLDYIEEQKEETNEVAPNQDIKDIKEFISQGGKEATAPKEDLKPCTTKDPERNEPITPSHSSQTQDTSRPVIDKMPDDMDTSISDDDSPLLQTPCPSGLSEEGIKQSKVRSQTEKNDFEEGSQTEFPVNLIQPVSTDRSTKFTDEDEVSSVPNNQSNIKDENVINIEDFTFQDEIPDAPKMVSKHTLGKLDSSEAPATVSTSNLETVNIDDMELDVINIHEYKSVTDKSSEEQSRDTDKSDHEEQLRDTEKSGHEEQSKDTDKSGHEEQSRDTDKSDDEQLRDTDKSGHEEQSRDTNKSGHEEQSRDTFFENAPSLTLAPDFLINPYDNPGRRMDTRSDLAKFKFDEYSMHKWNASDKLFYNNIMGSNVPVDDSTTSVPTSREEIGKIIDVYNPMTNLPKFYDSMCIQDNQYILGKREIKSYIQNTAPSDEEQVKEAQSPSSRIQERATSPTGLKVVKILAASPPKRKAYAATSQEEEDGPGVAPQEAEDGLGAAPQEPEDDSEISPPVSVGHSTANTKSWYDLSVEEEKRVETEE